LTFDGKHMSGKPQSNESFERTARQLASYQSWVATSKVGACGRAAAQFRRYMGTRIVTVLCIGYLVLGSAAVSAENSPVQLDKISIHLCLENTGIFRDDITSIFGFATWNFRPFGIGFSDNDRFHSFLIKVWLSSEQRLFRLLNKRVC